MGKAGRPSKRQPSDVAKKLREELFAKQGQTLNVIDAAHVVDRDASTVLRLIRSGDLAATKRGREYEIAESDLREYVERAEHQRREQIRIGRIKREVQKEYEEIRGTPAAEFWSHIVCPDCRNNVLLRRTVASSTSEWTSYEWIGCCGICKHEHTFGYNEFQSVAKQDEVTKATFTFETETMDDIPF
jgi:excisionase family DNA binding protein